MHCIDLLILGPRSLFHLSPCLFRISGAVLQHKVKPLIACICTHVFSLSLSLTVARACKWDSTFVVLDYGRVSNECQRPDRMWSIDERILWAGEVIAEARDGG